MKKKVCNINIVHIMYLSFILTVFCAVNTFAEPVMMNEAGVINRQNLEMLRDKRINEKVIDTTDKEIERKNKLKEELEKEKDVVKGNLTYNPSFTLKQVNFVGNTVISDKKLQKLAKDIIGQEICLNDIMELTVKVSRFYQKKGYITSYAYLEKQEITDGIVTINIHESKVIKKESIGNQWERDKYLNDFVLAGKGLNYNNVFDAKTLQGAMKTLNRSDYMKGGVEISRDENKDTIVRLNVQDRFPLSLDMSWDDYGRDYTGRQRFTTILGMDNLTGFGDRIYGGTILAQDSKGALAGYEIPISKWGTKLGFDYSYSQSYLGGPYRDLDIKGYSNDYILKLTQPIINTANQDVRFTVAFDWLNSVTESGILGGLSDYTLRVLRTGISGVFDDRKGRTIANIGFDWGIDGIGATENIYQGPQSAFYKIVAFLARVQRLPKDCLGIVRVNGQYSGQALFPVEQMFIGGAYSIRGYQPSELIGDYGVAGSVELRTPIPGIKAIFPKKYEEAWARKVKLVLFYDWGYVKEHENMYDYPTNFLHSVGVGTYINLTDAISFQIGIGFPLLKKLDENSGRLYFAVNTELDKLFLKPKQRKLPEL